MNGHPTDWQIIYDGSSDHPPVAIPLRAGPLSVLYEEGALRYIKHGSIEIVRMIYPAVRDHNWGTAIPVISGKSISQTDKSFAISFECRYRHNEIDFTSVNTITGSPEGVIVFSMKGNANRSFLRNRIGLCVLLPLRECTGRKCLIEDVNGKKNQSVFPFHISPHQPAKDMKSVSWDINGMVKARLDFKGEVFEIEDHRNWTDASFKIYGTPLELPFPVEVKKGEEMEQSISLTVNTAGGAGTESLSDDKVHINYDDQGRPLPAIKSLDGKINIYYDDQGIPLPAIGTSLNGPLLSKVQCNRLIDAGFDHLRVELDLSRDGWKETWDKQIDQFRLLALPLELVLFTDDRYEGPLASFAQHWKKVPADIDAIILFHLNNKTTPSRLSEYGRRILGEIPVRKGIGGGTNAYFAELNRERADPGLVDFVAFSVNPQVHASDNRSVTETPEAQWWAIRSAKEYFGGIPVRVSPVTMKPRFNPNATGAEPKVEPGSLPSTADRRQMSLFAATWTVASIKRMALAGADGLTFFEPAGLHGIMDSPETDPVRHLFPVPGNSIFPVYHVLRQILQMKTGVVIRADSPDPLSWDMLVIKDANGIKIIVANFTNNKREVDLPFDFGACALSYLDETSFPDAWFNTSALDGRAFSVTPRSGKVSLSLKPYGIAFLNGLTNSGGVL
jgi:D-apionolactonase